MGNRALERDFHTVSSNGTTATVPRRSVSQPLLVLASLMRQANKLVDVDRAPISRAADALREAVEATAP